MKITIFNSGGIGESDALKNVEFCCREMMLGIVEGDIAINSTDAINVGFIESSGYKRVIKFCPFCGVKILKERRDYWIRT